MSRRRAFGLAVVFGLGLFGTGLAVPVAAVLPVEQEEQAAVDPAARPPVVAAIEVRSEVPLAEDKDFDALLDIAVGEPLTDLRVRRTLRNIQASGRGTEVEIYTRPAAGESTPGVEGSEAAEAGEEVVAVVVLRAAVQVAGVHLAGTLGLSKDALQAVLSQRAGQPLSEDQVLAGVYRLEDLYETRGYYDAKVRVRVSTDEASRRATVIYEIDSGPQAVVDAIDFDGVAAPFTAENLIAHMGALKRGTKLDEGAASQAIEKLRHWLFAQGYNLAKVELPSVEHVGDAKVHLRFKLEIGPKLQVLVVGASLDKLRDKGFLPFLGDEGFDEALVEQALGKIRDYYQQEGYYKVVVDKVETLTVDTLLLTLTIQPGKVYTLEDIRFDGNHGVSDAELAELMELSGKKLLTLGSGRLVQSVLDQDLDNIRSFYAGKGYTRSRVGPVTVAEKGDRLRLSIPIVEGPRERVGELQWNGVESIPVADLVARLDELPLKVQGPFHPALLDLSVDALREAYADRGFDAAQVGVTPTWNADHTVVGLAFSVVEGPQAVVERVIVRGNQATRTDVILRTTGLVRRQPISLNRLRQVERALYGLGIFSRVDVQLTRAGLGVAGRDVVIRVEEGKPRTIAYGLGYDSEEGVRTTVGWTHSNVAGRAYSLSTDLRFSQKQDRVARILFDQPYFGPLALPVTSSLFYIVTEDQQKGFTVTKWGARTQANKTLGAWHYSLGLDYRVDKVELKSGVALNELERRDQPYQIASVIPSILLDHRNDPLIPTRGWSSLLQAQFSLPVLGSQAKFLKTFFQQTQLINLGKVGVLAGSLRLGAIEPFRTLPSTDPNLQELPSRNVFIDERFFAGGSTTHRAYGLDLLGIRGQTLFLPTGQSNYSPVGGNGLALANLDYRFPITESFGGTIFFDYGNVWADWRDLNTKDLKPGVGVGVRYLSPIGPLRLEVGWKLRRERGEDAKPAVFISFGNPF